ncbi:MAG: hypothetical protein ABR907_02930 [Terracidiphilus sp.]|jgi:hypothetical protein
MCIKPAFLALSLLVSQLAMGQAAPTEITNSDVVSMTRAGIGEQTIILAIQRGPVKFDTSPQALIALKASGVTDLVLNAILASVSSKDQVSPETSNFDAHALFQRALDAIGPHDKLAAILSLRWVGTDLQSFQGGGGTFEREQIKIYPDKLYGSLKSATGHLQKDVVTPDFNYRSSGNMITTIPLTDLETVRGQLTFDIIYIAQHAEDYTVSPAGEEQVGGVTADNVKISKSGMDIIWKIDSKTGRLLSSRIPGPSGDTVTNFSDWRLVNGVNFPFKRHSTGPKASHELTIAQYEINPTIDEELFQRPAESMSQGLTLKILQEQSVPYIQESGGGISSSCNIVGSANTSAYANTFGNSTYGNATTNSNQHMSCNSYDTTVRWPHVLNVMFAEASDGNSYMFACDRAWRWSKCVPLRVGQVFNARFTDKGLEVEAFNTKGKEENPTYHVLQSKSLR